MAIPRVTLNVVILDGHITLSLGIGGIFQFAYDIVPSIFFLPVKYN